MSCPSKRTFPDTRAPRTSSCIRLMHRISVDLPHPEGPMMEVTACGSATTATSRSAWSDPNHALRSWTSIRREPRSSVRASCRTASTPLT